jgi:hypothetical protein
MQRMGTHGRDPGGPPASHIGDTQAGSALLRGDNDIHVSNPLLHICELCRRSGELLVGQQGACVLTVFVVLSSALGGYCLHSRQWLRTVGALVVTIE